MRPLRPELLRTLLRDARLECAQRAGARPVRGVARPESAPLAPPPPRSAVAPAKRKDSPSSDAGAPPPLAAALQPLAGAGGGHAGALPATALQSLDEARAKRAAVSPEPDALPHVRRAELLAVSAPSREGARELPPAPAPPPADGSPPPPPPSPFVAGRSSLRSQPPSLLSSGHSFSCSCVSWAPDLGTPVASASSCSCCDPAERAHTAAAPDAPPPSPPAPSVRAGARAALSPEIACSPPRRRLADAGGSTAGRAAASAADQSPVPAAGGGAESAVGAGRSTAAGQETRTESRGGSVVAAVKQEAPAAAPAPASGASLFAQLLARLPPRAPGSREWHVTPRQPQRLHGADGLEPATELGVAAAATTATGAFPATSARLDATASVRQKGFSAEVVARVHMLQQRAAARDAGADSAGSAPGGTLSSAAAHSDSRATALLPQALPSGPPHAAAPGLAGTCRARAYVCM